MESPASVMPQANLSQSQKGVSNTTLAVLVMLALIMTVIGTWAVLSSISSVEEARSSGTNVGEVSFVVIPSASNRATGLVSMEIER